MTTKQKQAVKEFEDMKDNSELRALSDLSLVEPLTEEQYQKMMSLAKKLNIIKN